MLPSLTFMKSQLYQRVRKAFTQSQNNVHRRTISFSTHHRHQRSFSMTPFTTSFRQPYSTSPILGHSTAALLSYEEREEEGNRVDEDTESFFRDSMSQLLPHASSSRLDLESDDIRSLHNNNLMPKEASEVENYDVGFTEKNTQIPANSDTLIGRGSTHVKSARELLTNFDPLNEPAIFESGNQEQQMIDLQLWMECNAQNEALKKHQKNIEAARKREDYTSLSIVQRQLVQWYNPLKEAIEAHQFKYLTGVNSKTVLSGKKFGPYICALPAAKLAMITANTTILQTTLKATSKQEKSGTPLVTVAGAIGKAVEDEVIIHRLLHKRFLDAKEERRHRKVGSEGGAFENSVEGFASLSVDTDDTDSVVAECVTSNLINDEKVNITHKWSYAASHLKDYIEELSRTQVSKKNRSKTSYAVKKARQALESSDEWSETGRLQLGAALLQCLLETATIEQDYNKKEMAFEFEKKWIGLNKLKGFVLMNKRLFDLITSDNLKSLSATTTRHKPMIVPPRLWTGPRNGGYLMLEVDIMRHHRCETQREALAQADLSLVFDGLNALGRVKWKINKPVLEAAWRCWNDNIPLGDIPSRTDFPVPDEPEILEKPTEVDADTPLYNEYLINIKSYFDQRSKYNRTLQKNNDLRSLRCSAQLKLDQAEQFKEFEAIYFPYNMDFRGRAYPVPPHLSNVGSDLCRGMLMFAEAKPLGERGLYWLKVHLANFAGKDKMKYDDRVKFIDDNMDKVRESVLDPFGSERWWMSLEDPFQGLATCFEIFQAIESGDPKSYLCSLPVHMDGSCNGLQHYAALGRDYTGGKAVNLCAFDEPQDVYVGVMHEVIRLVAEEAERDLGFDTSDPSQLSTEQKRQLKSNRAAKLVNGIIDRGVVKRTVMTSVYGVTYVGARTQIQEKIESKLEGKGYDVDDINREVFQACGYLAVLTMDVIGQLFSGAKETMTWLTTCARLITHHGYPVAWISPIGLPAIQPYRQKKMTTLVTLMQTISITKEGDGLPLHKARQATAFPPNFIHSLDSSHMLLTALEMDRRGLTFSAVHDSFWTHPCDVDEMNTALREVFIDLYSQPLLERLKDTWEKRYPQIDFPPLPKRGNLDLQEVMKAKYFFQ